MKNSGIIELKGTVCKALIAAIAGDELIEGLPGELGCADGISDFMESNLSFNNTLLARAVKDRDRIIQSKN